jgi:hypothetical protein
MKKLLFLIQRLQNSYTTIGGKISTSSDFAAMLCFVLGVYGERFFLYVYSLLGEISPETFSFVCLIGTYSIIVRFIHSL